MVTIRFYTRQGCHLCEIAEAALREEQRRIEFHLEIHDIDADPELRELYTLLVPVTVLPGGDEMHYRIDTAKLRRTLATS